MTKKASVAKLSHLAHGETTGPADIDELNRTRVLRIGYGLEAAAGNTTELTLGIMEDAVELVSAKYIPGNALTANDTNYATLTLGSADGAGGAVTAFDAFTTKITGGSGDWVQGVPETFTIVTSTDTLTEGQALVVDIAKAAAGVAIPTGVFEVVYRVL